MTQFFFFCFGVSRYLGVISDGCGVFVLVAGELCYGVITVFPVNYRYVVVHRWEHMLSSRNSRHVELYRVDIRTWSICEVHRHCFLISHSYLYLYCLTLSDNTRNVVPVSDTLFILREDSVDITKSSVESNF